MSLYRYAPAARNVAATESSIRQSNLCSNIANYRGLVIILRELCAGFSAKFRSDI
jgi:hypothetical protein